MSVFLFLIVHRLADLGVPMMDRVETMLDPGPFAAAPAAHRAESARTTTTQARVAPDAWERRPKEINQANRISNGF